MRHPTRPKIINKWFIKGIDTPFLQISSCWENFNLVIRLPKSQLLTRSLYLNRRTDYWKNILWSCQKQKKRPKTKINKCQNENERRNMNAKSPKGLNKQLNRIQSYTTSSSGFSLIPSPNITQFSPYFPSYFNLI